VGNVLLPVKAGCFGVSKKGDRTGLFVHVYGAIFTGKTPPCTAINVTIGEHDDPCQRTSWKRKKGRRSIRDVTAVRRTVAPGDLVRTGV